MTKQTARKSTTSQHPRSGYGHGGRGIMANYSSQVAWQPQQGIPWEEPEEVTEEERQREADREQQRDEAKQRERQRQREREREQQEYDQEQERQAKRPCLPVPEEPNCAESAPEGPESTKFSADDSVSSLLRVHVIIADGTIDVSLPTAGNCTVAALKHAIHNKTGHIAWAQDLFLLPNDGQGGQRSEMAMRSDETLTSSCSVALTICPQSFVRAGDASVISGEDSCTITQREDAYGKSALSLTNITATSSSIPVYAEFKVLACDCDDAVVGGYIGAVVQHSELNLNEWHVHKQAYYFDHGSYM